MKYSSVYRAAFIDFFVVVTVIYFEREEGYLYRYGFLPGL